MSARAGGGLLLLLSLGLIGLCGRLAWIRVNDAPRLLTDAARQQRSLIPIAARRGVIVDCNGRILAGSRLRQSVFADAGIIADRNEAAQALARILRRDAVEVSADLQAAGERRFFVLARDITDEQAEAIRTAAIPGFGLFDDPIRSYPMASTAAALMGFVAADGHGVSGLEHQFEPWLIGQPGYKTVVRDVRRRAFWLAEDGYQPPRDGLNLVLTLDAVVQENVERVLAETVDKFEAESGVAIVMRPGTGEVLAIANYPGFDPNEYPDYAPSRYRNRAITDPVEPGSIFKPFVAAGALQAHSVRLEDMIDCHMGVFADGVRVLHDHHPYGVMTFQDVVVHSSNIGMAIVGKRMGNERLERTVRAFGFGEPTGSGLEGEDGGIVRSKWDSLSTTSIPMGHEIAVTPLQIARAFCALANGGRLVRPRIVRAILEGEDHIVRDLVDDEPALRIFPESVVAMVKDELMVPVVQRGTGVNAALVGYQVFGKSGTAQIARHGGGGYIANAYQSSFIGGAPARAPQVIALVSITKPNKSKGYYGGTVAAPAVGDILAHALAYLRIPPDEDDGRDAATVTALRNP